jgi:hypothetical protein
MKYIFLDFMRKVRNKNMCQMYLDLCVRKGIATRVADDVFYAALVRFL